MSYSYTMNSVPNLGRGLIGLPTRQEDIQLDQTQYDSILSKVQADYPDVPTIEGIVLGQNISSAIDASTNVPRFFVFWDYYNNTLSNSVRIKGQVSVSYRTSNQVFAVLLDAASETNPTAGQQASVDPDKYMFTTASGKTAIAGLYWAAFDDGQTVRTDSYGRKIALVEVI